MSDKKRGGEPFLFLRYLKSHLKTIVLLCIFTVIFAGSFLLYQLPAAAVWYAAAICFFIGGAALIFDYLAFRRKHQSLKTLLREAAVTLEQLLAFVNPYLPGLVINETLKELKKI